MKTQSFERARPSTKAAKYFWFISLQCCTEILSFKYQDKYFSLILHRNTFIQISGQIFLVGIAAKYFQSNIRKNISLQYCTKILSIKYQEKYCSAILWWNTFNQILFSGGWIQRNKVEGCFLFSNNTTSQRIAQNYRNGLARVFSILCRPLCSPTHLLQGDPVYVQSCFWYVNSF